MLLLCRGRCYIPGNPLSCIGLLLLLLLSEQVLIKCCVAQRASVLNVEPLSQTDPVEEVVAPGQLGAGHVLVADGAHVVVLLQLFPKNTLKDRSFFFFSLFPIFFVPTYFEASGRLLILVTAVLRFMNVCQPALASHQMLQ